MDLIQFKLILNSSRIVNNFNKVVIWHYFIRRLLKISPGPSTFCIISLKEVAGGDNPLIILSKLFQDLF